MTRKSANRPTTDRVSTTRATRVQGADEEAVASGRPAQQDEAGGEQGRERRDARAAAQGRRPRRRAESVGSSLAATGVVARRRRPRRGRRASGAAEARRRAWSFQYAIDRAGRRRRADRRRYCGEVGVRHRSRPAAGIASPVLVAVALRQLAEQEAERPAVADEVVDREQQDMLVVADAEQPGAQQRRASEVERRVLLRRSRAGGSPLRASSGRKRPRSVSGSSQDGVRRPRPGFRRPRGRRCAGSRAAGRRALERSARVSRRRAGRAGAAPGRRCTDRRRDRAAARSTSAAARTTTGAARVTTARVSRRRPPAGRRCTRRCPRRDGAIEGRREFVRMLDVRAEPAERAHEFVVADAGPEQRVAVARVRRVDTSARSPAAVAVVVGDDHDDRHAQADRRFHLHRVQAEREVAGQRRRPAGPGRASFAPIAKGTPMPMQPLWPGVQRETGKERRQVLLRRRQDPVAVDRDDGVARHPAAEREGEACLAHRQPASCRTIASPARPFDATPRPGRRASLVARRCAGRRHRSPRSRSASSERRIAAEHERRRIARGRAEPVDVEVDALRVARDLGAEAERPVERAPAVRTTSALASIDARIALAQSGESSGRKPCAIGDVAKGASSRSTSAASSSNGADQRSASPTRTAGRRAAASRSAARAIAAGVRARRDARRRGAGAARRRPSVERVLGHVEIDRARAAWPSRPRNA